MVENRDEVERTREGRKGLQTSMDALSLYGARGYGALTPCRRFNIYIGACTILNAHLGDFGPRPWVPAKVAA